jgi:polysaccharide pyruvyl transferase WcaK-like protein
LNRIIIQGAGFADNFGDVLFYDIFLKESIKQNIQVDLISISEKVKRHIPYNEEEKVSLIKRIKNAEGIVFIGGGYLGEPPHPSPRMRFMWGLRTIKNILFIAPLGMIFRKKIIVIGPGAGPITNILMRSIVKRMANYSEKTIVRDNESYNFLKKIGVNEKKLVETVDTALLIKNYYDIEEATSEDSKSIIIHLSESPEDSDKSKIILRDVENFLSKNPHYKLKAITDHNGGGQNKAIEYLKKKYKDKVETHIYETPEKLINVINSSSVVITNKLHVAIVSTSLGKSVISVPNHTKVIRYFNQINESDRCISHRELNEGEVYELLMKYHDKFIKLEPSMFKRAEQNIKYFKEFVSI